MITIVFSPFQTFISSASSSASTEVSKFVSFRDLSNENEELKNKVNLLEQKVVELKVYIEENELLLKQNKYLESQGFNFLNARVISHSAENNPNLLIINRGESHGIKIGMAVVIEQGSLVGQIKKIEAQTSHVLLLVDNNFRLSASVAGESEIAGLVEGQNNISLSLNEILKNSEIKPGDLIVTSGFDENIPAGLLIGEIEEIVDLQGELFKSAKINLPVSLSNLRIVSVIMP